MVFEQPKQPKRKPLMKYSLAIETWGEEEKNAAKSVIDSGYCTMGKKTEQFEQEFAKLVGSKYAVMSNSGSSANLLMITAMMYKTNGLQPGDEILVPAVSWPTTYYPLEQCGLTMKFIDIDINTFNMDVSQLESAITPKTKGILAVNLLGVPNDMDALNLICQKHNLVLLEDNCESLNSTYKKKECGTFGMMGTFSTYFSHHICTIEGGMTITNDHELYEILLCLRSHGWIRNLPPKNSICNKSGHAFEDSFKFVLPGYNLRPNEIYAAVGLEQLKKLPKIKYYRKTNYLHLQRELSKTGLDKIIKLQTNVVNGDPNWFGFGFVLPTHINRREITNMLIANEIECRPIVGGNFVNNPVIKHLSHTTHGNLPNAEILDKHGFFIGNNGQDITEQIDYFIETINRFVS